jgi:hypothetical protein
MTVMMAAAAHNRPAVISALIEAGADVDQQDKVSVEQCDGYSGMMVPSLALTCCRVIVGRLDSAHVGGGQEPHCRCSGTDCCES